MNLLAISTTSSIEIISIIVTTLCIISLVVVIIKWRDSSDKGYRLGKYDGFIEGSKSKIEDFDSTSIGFIKDPKTISNTSKETKKISKNRINPSKLD